jgi:hypothetical protein
LNGEAEYLLAILKQQHSLYVICTTCTVFLVLCLIVKLEMLTTAHKSTFTRAPRMYRLKTSMYALAPHYMTICDINMGMRNDTSYEMLATLHARDADVRGSNRD